MSLVRVLVKLVAGLAVVLALAAVAVYHFSQQRLERRYEIAAFIGSIPRDEQTLAEGRRLATALGCSDCHAADLGGQVMVDDPAFGVIAAPDLTAHAGDSEAELLAWLNAGVRHGVGRDGRSLVIMPSAEYAGFSDRELLSIAAYLDSLQPLQRQLPQRRLGPVGRSLLVANKLKDFLPAELIDHTAQPPIEPPADGTLEHGAHFAELCRGCHGRSLSGSQPPTPGSPAAPNLTAHASGLASWSEDDFVRALRTGATPQGRQLDARFMPWKATSAATDAELRDLWNYLRTLPPLPRSLD